MGERRRQVTIQSVRGWWRPVTQQRLKSPTRCECVLSRRAARGLVWVLSWGMAFGPSLVVAASVKAYPVPGHGVLELAVPVGWRDSVRQQAPHLPPTITFLPAVGDMFQVLVTGFLGWRRNIAGRGLAAAP